MKSSQRPVEHILIIEDEFHIRRVLASILRAEGFIISEAGDGQQALDLLATVQPPHLILLDLMMPVMDGWTFRKVQLSRPDLSEIPVLVVSAGSDKDLSELQIEDHQFFQKPLQLDELFSAIQMTKYNTPRNLKLVPLKESVHAK